MKWLAAAAFIALSFPDAAHTCLVGAGDALIHTSIPDGLPADIVVLNVRLDRRDERLLYSTGLPARVDIVVQGPVSGSRIILQTNIQSSCEWPFENGTRGLIVGRLIGDRDGVPIIEPVFAPIENGFRLEPGDPVPMRPTLPEYSY